MHFLGEAVDEAVEARILRAPVQHLVVNLAVPAADDHRLDPIGIRQQHRQQLEVIVGAVAPGGEEDREQVGAQLELMLQIVPALRRTHETHVLAGLHQVPPHPGARRRHAELHGIVPGGRGAGDVEVGRGLHPVDAVAESAGKLAAERRAPHPVGAQNPPRGLEVTAVEAVVDAENQVRLVFAQHRLVVDPAESHGTAVQEAQAFHAHEVGFVQPGPLRLDPVVETHAQAIKAGGFLEHLLDAHVHIVPVKLEAPLREGLRPGIVARAGAGGENKDANAGHVQRPK